jgi:exonuclease I
LIREKQPKLYDWLFQLRSKQKVMDQIRLLQPMVHISGRFSAARTMSAWSCHWPGTRKTECVDCLRPAP